MGEMAGALAAGDALPVIGAQPHSRWQFRQPPFGLGPAAPCKNGFLPGQSQRCPKFQWRPNREGTRVLPVAAARSHECKKPNENDHKSERCFAKIPGGPDSLRGPRHRCRRRPTPAAPPGKNVHGSFHDGPDLSGQPYRRGPFRGRAMEEQGRLRKWLFQSPDIGFVCCRNTGNLVDFLIRFSPVDGEEQFKVLPLSRQWRRATPRAEFGRWVKSVKRSPWLTET